VLLLHWKAALVGMFAVLGLPEHAVVESEWSNKCNASERHQNS
jgi:hypothetical protein